MTPDELDQIEKRAEAAKSVTSDDRLESRLAWSEESQSTAYDVTAWMEDEGKHIPYHLVRCIAEETADLVIHGPDDISALVAEVRRLRGITDRIDGLAKRQVGNDPAGGESKRGWIYAHDIFAVLDELETR